MAFFSETRFKETLLSGVQLELKESVPCSAPRCTHDLEASFLHHVKACYLSLPFTYLLAEYQGLLGRLITAICAQSRIFVLRITDQNLIRSPQQEDLINKETHDDQTAENMCPWRAQPQMGHLDHTSFPQCSRDHYRRVGGKIVRVRGQRRQG